MSPGIYVLLAVSALLMLAAGVLTGSRGGWNAANSMASAGGILVAAVLVGAAGYLT
jgi:uncharacterized membrane protein